MTRFPEDEFDEPLPSGVCPECKKDDPKVEEVQFEVVDFGVGFYECHGVRGCQRDLRVVCPVCESEYKD